MQAILDACSGLPQAEFAEGEWLIREGASGGRLHVLVAGEVVVLKGDTEVTRISDPGAVFGEMSALLDLPYSASVRALGPVRVRLAEDGAGFLAANPAVALHTARILARRLHAATAYLADLKAQFADQKNHFAMMDRILDTLIERQSSRAPQPGKEADPRL
jgi:CRP-like cAMP-binding protein